MGKYLLERTIGKGNFAVVKLATHCDTHQKVAIKIIDKSRLDPADRKKLEREITVMKSLIHPYIIRLYEVMESKSLIYLVTEYAANGELLDLLIREKRLSEPKAKEKFRQLVLAVEYIHSQNVVHRDLKAENLLLDSRGNIKVADFGFANTFQPNSKLQTFCGSPPYAAPELYQCLPYSPEKVDVWSLGVLLYVFVCGHLPFDSNNLAELRKRVLSGQFRLPFYISSACGSLITRMLTVDPNQRYTINQIKQHPWLMLNKTNYNEPLITPNTSRQQSIPNCQLTNAILEHAESLGYNRTQILRSVNGNSYDSDAAIWHLLLEKFQQTCQIDTSHIPIEPVLNDESNSPDIARRSTAPIIFNETNTQLAYTPPNAFESIRPQLDPCDLQGISQQDTYQHQEPDVPLDYLDNYNIDDDDDDDDVEDEATSAHLREQYARTHGLRRHTIGRPDLLIHGGPIPNLAGKVRFAHQFTSIEPTILTNRLVNLQQQNAYEPISTSKPTTVTDNNSNDADEQEDEDRNDPIERYSQSLTNRYQHNQLFPISSNGLSGQSPVINIISDETDQQQTDNQYLSPPTPNNFHMNRRASDSGAHLLSFQQQYGVTGSNTFGALRPTTIHLQSPSSNRSSRGSITRGAPITPPIFPTTPREVEEDEDEDEDPETLARYLNRGKRHTVCEQGLLQNCKTRRGGTREVTKERSVASRRASDTSSNFINSTARAHLERLYNNAVNFKASDDDLTTSSIQELQKLQKQYSTNNSDRRIAAVPSPTNSIGLHMIQEEHQHHQPLLPNFSTYHEQSRSSSSSEGVAHDDDDENEMDCDINHHHHHLPPHHHSEQHLYCPTHFHHSTPTSFFCNTNNPLLAQHLPIPTTTSSYMP